MKKMEQTLIEPEKFYTIANGNGKVLEVKDYNPDNGAAVQLWDYTGGIGGPIKKDRLWYFLNLRNQGAHSSVSGMFANKNAGDPAKWTYEADPTRQSRTAASWTGSSGPGAPSATPGSSPTAWNCCPRSPSSHGPCTPGSPGGSGRDR